MLRVNKPELDYSRSLTNRAILKNGKIRSNLIRLSSSQDSYYTVNVNEIDKFGKL